MRNYTRLDAGTCFPAALNVSRGRDRIEARLNPMTVVIEEEEIASLPINVNPEIVSGTPVFDGTRVPVDALFNNLSAGVSLDDFLENFPSVSREQALAVLKFSHETLQKLGLSG